MNYPIGIASQITFNFNNRVVCVAIENCSFYSVPFLYIQIYGVVFQSSLCEIGFNKNVF